MKTRTKDSISAKLSLVVCLVALVIGGWMIINDTSSENDSTTVDRIDREQLECLVQLSRDTDVEFEWQWRHNDPWELPSAESVNLKINSSTDLPIYAIHGRGWDTTDFELEIASRLPRIQYVNLAYCCRISDEGIGSLAKLPSLRTLVLYRNHPRKAGNMVPRKVLENIEQWESHLTDKALFEIAKMPALESLIIGDNDFSEGAIFELAKCKTLRRLELDDSQISDEGLRKLRSMMPQCQIESWYGRSKENHPPSEPKDPSAAPEMDVTENYIEVLN